MRNLARLMLAATVLFAVPAAAQNAAVEAPITTFITAFNKGDVATAKSTMAEKVSITDEVAPFRWHGKDAFATWIADYDVDAKAKGITDPSVTILEHTRELVQGDAAYVIVPATYRFTQKGVKMAEPAQMTFALEKGPNGWKIAAWTWTGPDATPVQ